MTSCAIFGCHKARQSLIWGVEKGSTRWNSPRASGFMSSALIQWSVISNWPMKRWRTWRRGNQNSVGRFASSWERPRRYQPRTPALISSGVVMFSSMSPRSTRLIPPAGEFCAMAVICSSTRCLEPIGWSRARLPGCGTRWGLRPKAPDQSERRRPSRKRVFVSSNGWNLAAEWGEWAEEHADQGTRHLLHAARLLRAPERYIAQFGQAAYDIKLGDCLWHIYRMIGKLSPRIYLLSVAA